MSVELASKTLVHKPWGRTDLRPWSQFGQTGEAIGEIWFGRADAALRDSALLLKLLFTRAPLSIQVHPGDAYAKAAGLPNGKTEAWYVLAADHEARIALGLKKALGASDFRASMTDGTIAGHVAWRTVETGDAIMVPAGTIHAIGAGLVIAEIQQRSDTTYRLFDHGRPRALHIEEASAVALAGPPPRQMPPRLLSQSRTELAKSAFFTLEKVTLPTASDWWLNLGCESWLLVLAGHARIGSVEAGQGDAVYLDEDHARVEAGPDGLVALLAYALPGPVANLLEKPDRAFARDPSAANADRRAAMRPPVRSTEARS